MNWEATIAGVALVVSIGTAVFSYNADRNSQYRQRLFEISMLKMQSLESAMRDASRISSQLNRTLNAMLLSDGKDGGEIYVKNILQSYSDAVDVFNAVRHNLNESDVQAFDKVTTEYETAMFQTMQTGGTPTAQQLTDLTNIPARLKTMIDDAIENLHTNMATK